MRRKARHTSCDGFTTTVYCNFVTSKFCREQMWAWHLSLIYCYFIVQSNIYCKLYLQHQCCDRRVMSHIHPSVTICGGICCRHLAIFFLVDARGAIYNVPKKNTFLFSKLSINYLMFHNWQSSDYFDQWWSNLTKNCLTLPIKKGKWVFFYFLFLYYLTSSLSLLNDHTTKNTNIATAICDRYSRSQN